MFLFARTQNKHVYISQRQLFKVNLSIEEIYLIIFGGGGKDEKVLIRKINTQEIIELQCGKLT